jgi:large subunit ribosomal protein L13Ae
VHGVERTPANPPHSLEERRKAKGLAYYERKKVASRQLSEAKKNAGTKSETAQALAAYGY